MTLEPFAWAWPFLVTVTAVCSVRLHAIRRRRTLNRALHELRRPLQALALAPGRLRRGPATAPGPLELALTALDDLDAAVNGTRPAFNRRPVAARGLVEAALERWRGVAAGRDRSLSLEWRAGRAILLADPARIMQALDNLLANAIEHGGLRVRVAASIGPAGLRVVVATAAGERRGRDSDPRRGHGLAVVERVAAAHLGRFGLHRSGAEVRAVLELPLASAPLPAVPIERGAPGSQRSARGPAGGAPGPTARARPARPDQPVGPRAA